ncbi:unnamed protein product [Adineta ricciae]|uniref:Sulfatase N-terminal domain-containing protein n=1 Tax=Adineta ricciae TaxID=249248 RepID=A0A815SPH9_ADIRI|nr:unnamed protein product [Adineta ricciae]
MQFCRIILSILRRFILETFTLSKWLADSGPNVILIIDDDTSWSNLGTNWPNTRDTPFLYHLASISLRLTYYHSGASVSSVSRATLLTDRLPLRTDVWQNLAASTLRGLPTNETVLSEYPKTLLAF